MKKLCLSLADFLPLIAFFIAYRAYGLIEATAVLVWLSVIVTLTKYLFEKIIQIAPLITIILVVIFGTLTVSLEDELFIKLKPTLLNTLFGAVLLGGVLIYQKGLLQYVAGAVLTMSDEAWKKLSLRWAAFFFFMACLNEILWRSLPTDMWVNIRVFGYMPLTIVFALAQIPFIKRHMQQDEAAEAASS